MILQALVKYYEDLERQEKLPKQGWCQAKVSYGINLSTDGDIKNILWLKEERQAGKKQIWISQTMKVPAMLTRSSGVAANFLCDNSKYMLGIDKSGTGKRITECFEAAKEKHLKLLKNTSGEMAQAICAFFYKWNPEKAKENAAVLENWEEITDGGNLIFCMDKKYAQDDKEIEQIWNVESKQSETDISGICLVTGEKTEISRIHRNIKGVPGAQSSGAALVSFNAPSFESYGKEQSYNAPVGKYAEFAYTSALNYLLAQKKYTFPLGDSIIVYWAEEAKTEYQDALLALLNPVKDNQSEVHGFFEKLRKDEQIIIDDIELNPSQKFYILCLAPNAARLSVRFFYQSSFGNITKNLACHYERMQMIKPKWEEREYLGIEDMLKETVNMNSRDKKTISNMAAMAFSAILQNSRYPASLYTDTLIRIRAEQGCVTWGRVSIVKAFLIKNYKNTEGEICIVSFGYRGVSPALMGSCAEKNISLCFMTPQGKFLARITGKTRGNVLLREQQYASSLDSAISLEIAKNCILGKVYNARWVLERCVRDHSMQVDADKIKIASEKLKHTLGLIQTCESKAQLRGFEGEAASVYFGVFDEMILQQKKDFSFQGRNKRPPLDNMNAMLSFVYTLLTNTIASSLECVGLDPYVGYLHTERPGRVSLALDMIEELRAVLADRFVLSLVNKKIVNGKNFTKKENGAVLMDDELRKKLLVEWQKKKKETITHPFLKEKVEWGMVPYVQAMLLARYLRGDLDSYPVFLWK